jgi:hydrogenase nickel incorporation protein HypA/HybF
MHEFSIALNIIDIATSEAEKAGVTNVQQIEIEIGKSSGVVREALEFALETAVKDTVLTNSAIIITETRSVLECNSCKHRFPTEYPIGICPACGEVSSNLVSGKELKVLSITV